MERIEKKEGIYGNMDKWHFTYGNGEIREN